MNHCDLSQSEQRKRKEIAEHTRKMILSELEIESQDEISLMAGYRDYYLQISFSELHPLLVFCLAKALEKPSTARQRQMTNELNLHSILGSHAINDEVAILTVQLSGLMQNWMRRVFLKYLTGALMRRTVDM